MRGKGEVVDECLHCGSELPEELEGPCPYCGRAGKKIKVEIHESVTLRDDLAVGITDGTTGRYALHSDSKNPTDAVLIEQLVGDFLSGAIEPLRGFVESLVTKFDSPATLDGTFYRGVKATTRPKLSNNKIGPSPTPREGRYNAKDEKALYLIDNPGFLKAEIGSSDVLVQEYRINLSRLRVADLSPANKEIANSLSLLFQAAERGKTGAGLDFEAELERQNRSKYSISQTLSSAFKNHGWEGLYVPGVHGEGERHYRNLAIFGVRVDYWQSWTVGTFRLFADGSGWKD